MASPSADINYLMQVVSRDCMLVCINEGIQPDEFNVEDAVHEQLDAHFDDMSLDRKKELLQLDGTSQVELVASIESRPRQYWQDGLLSLSQDEYYSALLWELLMVKYDLVEYVRQEYFVENEEDLETDDETDDKLDISIRTKPMDELERSIEDWVMYVPVRDTKFSRYIWDVQRIQPDRDGDSDTDTEDA